MADFTLLRFNECNATFIGRLKQSKDWIIFWLVAILLLFFCLGTGAITGSEGRWLAVAREMINSGDYLHPTINGEAYFDKPLVSYWLIVVCSFFGHALSEFTARVPSALSVLLMLGAVISISKKVFGDKTALTAAWITLTCYSTLFWGRLAEADMENTAFIAAAIAWYFHCREQKSFFRYLLFWFLCAVGAQTKGLAAIVIPCCAAGIDIILTKKYLFHLNWRFVLAFCTGVLIYAIPFLAESMVRGEYGASGIVLVFRENIVRAINPWDHKDKPFWCYFYYLPRLLIPWSPFFIMSFIYFIRKAVTDWKNMKSEERWLLLLIVFIFIMFSASRSRRVYYILPIVPFCTVLTAGFLTEIKDGWEAKLSRIFLAVFDWIIPFAGILALSAPLLFRYIIYPNFFSSSVKPEIIFVSFFYFLLPSAGLVLLILWETRRRGLWKEQALRGRVLPCMAVITFITFSVMLPYFNGSAQTRTTRAYLRMMHTLLYDELQIPAGNTAFFDTNLSHGVFYLDPPEHAKLYNVAGNKRSTRTFLNDTFDVGDIKDFRAALDKIEKEGGVVFFRADAMKREDTPQDIKEKFCRGNVYTYTDNVVPEFFSSPELAILEKKKPGAKKVERILKQKIIAYVVPPPEKRSVNPKIAADKILNHHGK